MVWPEIHSKIDCNVQSIKVQVVQPAQVKPGQFCHAMAENGLVLVESSAEVLCPSVIVPIHVL